MGIRSKDILPKYHRKRIGEYTSVGHLVVGYYYKDYILYCPQCEASYLCKNVTNSNPSCKRHYGTVLHRGTPFVTLQSLAHENKLTQKMLEYVADKNGIEITINKTFPSCSIDDAVKLRELTIEYKRGLKNA